MRQCSLLAVLRGTIAPLFRRRTKLLGAILLLFPLSRAFTSPAPAGRVLLLCARAAAFASAAPARRAAAAAAWQRAPLSPSSPEPRSRTSSSPSSVTLRDAREVASMGSNMGFDFTNPNASAPAKGVGLSAEQQERLARNRAEALKRKAEHEARAAGAGREASTPTAGGVAGLGGGAGDGTLVATLQELFGYSKFRHEQRDVCEAVLSGRDVCVFWATGSGKSMCYQIPAFHLEKTVFVVSPLISLMNDQVTTINNKVDLGDRASKWQGRPLPPATFLGTAGNAGHEEPALQGLFRLVYVTPEKVASGNFLERVGALARQGKVALIAIDEAHCVSQWGPDFRPSFFDLKQIRNALPTVPLMALTATAVPRVKQDIRDILQLRDPFVSIGSFDRPNLKISVHRKISMSTDLMKLVDTLLRDPSGSTLVYVPTIKETEQVARFLSDKLPTVSVRFYHGSLALDERDNTHTQFLSGEARVVVATQAFGMGIDKPDIRRVVHYGAPKTFEEYYQQIGRAGRDGGPAACDMYCADNDFSKYDQEFYTGKLSDTAKAAVKESTSALRAFANNHEGCRRLSILTFFREVPSWGERCGTCDTCLRQKVLPSYVCILSLSLSLSLTHTHTITQSHIYLYIHIYVYVYVYVDVFVFLYVYVCISFISWNLRHAFAPKDAPVQVHSVHANPKRGKSAAVPWISSILNPIMV